MAADLGFVAHAAERHAHGLAPERRRNRLGQRGLADARRPDEAEKRTLRRRTQFADSEVLEDPILDALQS